MDRREEIILENNRSLRAARIFSAAVGVLGLGFLAVTLAGWNAALSWHFVTYLLLAMMASGLRVGMPAYPGILSAGYPFVLIGLMNFSLAENVVIGCGAMLVQAVADCGRERRVSAVLFPVATVAIAVSWAHWLFWSTWSPDNPAGPAAPMLAAAAGLYLLNSFPVATREAWQKGKRVAKLWHQCSFWALPGYLIGVAVALVIGSISQAFGWRIATAVLPALYVVYRWANRYLADLRVEQADQEELSEEKHRIIETLGMAIEARQHTTDDRLKRTEVYSVGIARKLGLSQSEVEALRVAANLHDIGILAVPEQITAKAGRLTHEEFEKVKVHCVVGETIVERAKFRFPVAPIVRSHHERWDGSGYPDGLKGLDIPVGARILGVVDTFAALLVNRPYRKAIRREHALDHLTSQAGVLFDPDVVVAMLEFHEEFERELQKRFPAEERDFLSTISAARRETYELFQLSQELGRSLSLSETLSTFVAHLERLTPSDGLAIFLEREGRLVPEFASGPECSLVYGLELEIGKGISGSVAETGQPRRNADPALEFTCSKNDGKATAMRSALAVPLEGAQGSVGVLTLYRRQPNAFTTDDQRVVLEVSGRLATSIANSLHYQSAADSATTDSLTGLDNARSLFLHLDSELARCGRSGEPLTVLVCDLDGFKAVNDIHGHMAGNNVLKAVAAVLKANCREYDFVARMGGDEFVMVLPGLPEGAVSTRSKVLADAVAQAAEEACAGSGVSISVGQARYPDDGRDAEAMLAHADQRMYQSKEHRKLAASSRGFAFDYISSVIH